MNPENRMMRKLRRVTLGIGSVGGSGVGIHPCSNQELLGGASAEAVLLMTAPESNIVSATGLLYTMEMVKQNLVRGLRSR